jgi:hypothetical protein
LSLIFLTLCCAATQRLDMADRKLLRLFLTFAAILCLSIAPSEATTWWQPSHQNVAQVQQQDGHHYLLGVGKADITGFVMPWNFQ